MNKKQESKRGIYMLPTLTGIITAGEIIHTAITYNISEIIQQYNNTPIPDVVKEFNGSMLATEFGVLATIGMVYMLNKFGYNKKAKK